MKIRQSVPTKGMAEKYLTGNWRYVMPDFDRKDFSIIEAIFDSSNRVPNNTAKPGREDVERTPERA